MSTIREILEMTQYDRKKYYKASGIEKVTIDGNEFTDYGAFSFLWEKSYVKSPVRAADGSIGNLNSYSTFVTPHLKIDFSIMSIDSYRRLMKLIYSKNEFIVTCYDVVNNQMTTNKMYFTTEEMPKLWTIARAFNGEEYVELLGVQEYSVEMVGTNTDLSLVDILYYKEDGITLLNDATQTVVRGEEVVIGYNYTAPNQYRFEGIWVIMNEGSTSGSSLVRNGDAITANTYSESINHIRLKAVVVPTNEYDLAISYGNGKEIYNSSNSEVVNSVKIIKGQTLSTAFSNSNIILSNGNKLTFPSNGTEAKSVEYEGLVYTPYTFEGWFWTPTKSEATRVNGNTVFNSDFNRTIYQLYTPKSFQVTYITNSNYVSLDSVLISYGVSIPLPKPRSEGYTFVGWYEDSAFVKKFDKSTMPPKDITLYAKWVKNQ